MLLNVLSGARYVQDGAVVEIPAGGELLNSTHDLDFLPGFHLEGFANRDSTIYEKLYGIQSAKTILRGTLRYKVSLQCHDSDYSSPLLRSIIIAFCVD